MRIPRTETLTRLLTGAVIATTPVLAGCGTAATTSTTANQAASASATTSGASRTATSATTSKTTSAATPTGGPSECRAAELVLSYLGGQGATGHGDLGFALRNKGRRRCHTYGYPGIQFLDRAGKALPTVPTHSTEDFFGHSPLRALVVAPGASVSFRLDVSHGSGSPGRCPTAIALAVIPPDDTHALSTSITNGAYECGHAIVSPLGPGLSAHP
ncbi:MAG TPA: DUF4232 domain-containing protein [Solirubrobacteraceae bacterium]